MFQEDHPDILARAQTQSRRQDRAQPCTAAPAQLLGDLAVILRSCVKHQLWVVCKFPEILEGLEYVRRSLASLSSVSAPSACTSCALRDKSIFQWTRECIHRCSDATIRTEISTIYRVGTQWASAHLQSRYPFTDSVNGRMQCIGGCAAMCRPAQNS